MKDPSAIPETRAIDSGGPETRPVLGPLDPQNQLPEVRPGDVIAERYRVVAHLGTGGTAAVYKVEDILAKQVIALKLLRPGAAQNPKVLENFRKELSIARTLSHPNVVRIFDIGEYRGSLFYVMEYVDGRTLAEYLVETGRLSVQDFFPIFREFCQTLAWVHAQGVLHRDIKPSNVMFTQAGTLKLMDFGVARLLGGQHTVGTVIGTPGYVAPEQLFGLNLAVTSDIYSAGAMFFELLTGKRPLADVKLADLCTNPPPSLLAERPDVTPELAALVERCLEPEPARRFQSVAELAEAGAGVEARLTAAAYTRTRLADQLVAPSEPATAVPLMLRIVNRVREIHAAGQFHQDLSPRNIWITGLGAVEIDSYAAPPVQGTLMITEPKYVSPETFRQRTASDVRACISSDIYILGFLFYEMVLGQAVFEQQFASGTGPAEYRWLQWHGDASRTLPPLKQLARGCPKALSELLGRMLEKDVSRRLQSLDEAAQALREMHLRLEDTQKFGVSEDAATPAAAGRRSRKWLYAIVAAVVLVLCFAAAVSQIPSLRGPGQAQPKKPVTPEPKPEVQTPVVQEPKENPKSLTTPSGAMTLIPGDKPFYIDTYEVTNGAYAGFAAAEGRALPENPSWDRHYVEKAGYPAMNMSWDDAARFCARAGKRLPAAAEWEKAALGTDGRKYPWGNFVAQSVANWKGGDDGHPYAAPVGAFPFDFSPYGVLDMAGNVSEWVADKSIRGGWYGMTPEEYTLTPPMPEPGAFSPVGFRCAADVPEALKLVPGQ